MNTFYISQKKTSNRLSQNQYTFSGLGLSKWRQIRNESGIQIGKDVWFRQMELIMNPFVIRQFGGENTGAF